MLTFFLHSRILKILTVLPFLFLLLPFIIIFKNGFFFQVGPQLWLGITEKGLDMCMAAGLKRAHIRAALVGMCFELYTECDCTYKHICFQSILLLITLGIQ